MNQTSDNPLAHDYQHRPVVAELDVRTHRGVELDITVERAFHDRCWRLQNLWAYQDGQAIGYLRMMEVDTEAFERLYPTVFDYMRKRRGYSGVEGRDDLRRWGRVEEKLKQARRQMQRERVLSNCPWVAMAKVGADLPASSPRDDRYRDQGVGTALYVSASLYQGQKGKRLWGLDHPSTSARHVWDTLLEKPFGGLLVAQEIDSPFDKDDSGRQVRYLQARGQDWPSRLDLQALYDPPSQSRTW